MTPASLAFSIFFMLGLFLLGYILYVPVEGTQSQTTQQTTTTTIPYNPYNHTLELACRKMIHFNLNETTIAGVKCYRSGDRCLCIFPFE